MTEIHSNPDPGHRGLVNAGAVGAFDYSSLSPETANALRKKSKDIRYEVGLAAKGIVLIGRDLKSVKDILEHGQFVLWVQQECNFSVRSAQKFLRAAAFVDGKSASAALLTPGNVYRLSAKNAPPEVVNAVIERAAAGEISEAEIAEMFREYDEQKRGAARKGSETDECVKNVQEILKRFGPEGAAFLLGIRKDLAATLALLEREISSSAGSDVRGTA
jgi:hypothetical protein